MKKTHLVALFLATFVGCADRPEEPAHDAPTVEPPKGSETTPNPLDLAVKGNTSELVEALERGSAPVFVVLRAGAKLSDGDVVGDKEFPAARAVRLRDDKTLVVELLRNSVDTELEVALADAQYLKEIDLARLGQETERAATTAVQEIDDFDLDEASRRTEPTKGIVPGGLKDFDCIARFARISASRDFIPFPLTNCSAPQDPVGDPERIADAVQAKKVAQNIYNQQLADYNNAQAMIAALNARLAAIRNAYVFIRFHPHFKEYNVLHFKDFLHGRKSYNDRFEKAQQLLAFAALAAQAQIDSYSQVPPPSVTDSRSQANRIVARKWNCVLGQGLLNNAGRSGSNIVGVSLETVGAPFIDIQVMLDDHPPLPSTDGWGGLFGVTSTTAQPTDVTRFPVAGFVPVRATVGLPIVMFRFQPLDAKKTRPVGKACNLRAGIVL